jgi:hypothetical protein
MIEPRLKRVICRRFYHISPHGVEGHFKFKKSEFDPVKGVYSLPEFMK